MAVRARTPQTPSRRWRFLAKAGLVALIAAAGAAGAQTSPAPQQPAPKAAPPKGPEPQSAPASPPAVAPTPQAAAPAPSVLPQPSVTEPAPQPPAAPAPVAEVEEKPAPPAKRSRYDVAVLQALDKITAETVRFEAAVGKPVRYKTLVFTVKACERTTADEPANDAIAYLTVESQPKAAPGKPTPAPRQAFRGWMFASSPGLNPLEHPVYDAWLITCRAASPS